MDAYFQSGRLEYEIINAQREAHFANDPFAPDDGSQIPTAPSPISWFPIGDSPDGRYEATAYTNYSKPELTIDVKILDRTDLDAPIPGPIATVASAREAVSAAYRHLETLAVANHKLSSNISNSPNDSTPQPRAPRISVA